MNFIDVKISEYEFDSVLLTIENHLTQIKKYNNIIDNCTKQEEHQKDFFIKYQREKISDRLLILEGIIKVMDLCTRFMTDEPNFKYHLLRIDYIDIKESFYYGKQG